MTDNIDYKEIIRFIRRIPDLNKEWVPQEMIIQDLVLNGIINIKHTSKQNGNFKYITSYTNRSSNPFIKNIRRFEKNNEIWLEQKKGQTYYKLNSKGNRVKRKGTLWKINQKGLQKHIESQQKDFQKRMQELFLDMATYQNFDEYVETMENMLKDVKQKMKEIRAQKSSLLKNS